MDVKKPGPLKLNWLLAIKEKHFIPELLFSILILVLTMKSFSLFTQFIEQREGVVFNDPVLILFSAIDLTWPIFSLIYGALVFGIITIAFRPNRLLVLFESYSLMILLRMLMMYLLPLNPPEGMIVLEDPFVSFFVIGKTLTRDLFFSGHTATMFMLYLCISKKLKKLFLVVTLLVAAGVLGQKVHYTIDVIVAPFVSFVAFHIVSKLRSSFKWSN